MPCHAIVNKAIKIHATQEDPRAWLFLCRYFEMALMIVHWTDGSRDGIYTWTSLLSSLYGSIRL